MLSLNQFFSLLWKTVLGYFVFLISVISVPVFNQILAVVSSSEQVQNYIQGTRYLVINEAKIRILLADSSEERIKGLSGRQSLDQDQGMLFVFEKEDFHGIWMKEMFFPIDIIWLDSSFQVVDFTKNATPESYPNTFKPKAKVKYVLEVNSGFIDREGIKIFDQATFLK